MTLSDRRGLQIIPLHGCGVLTPPARHVASLSLISPWETVSAVRTMRLGARSVSYDSLKLWNVLSVVMLEQTTALGVRGVEGCSGNKLFQSITTVACRNERPNFRARPDWTISFIKTVIHRIDT